MRPIMIVPYLCVLLAGTIGGFALGGFATGGTRAVTNAGTDYGSLIDSASAAEIAPAPAIEGPDHYTCRGCGPTLAERKAQAYSVDYASVDPGYEAAYDLAKDYSPLPAYQPLPYSGDEAAAPPAR